MLTKRTTASHMLSIFIVFVSLVLGYQLGKANSAEKTKELNSTLLEFLARRSDLPLDDIELDRVEYGEMSYFPFNFETNILDYAYIQFSGTYIPTGEHFSLRHHINIYKPGNAPDITATETLYNDSIARHGKVKLLSLRVLDANSWGFCYTESYTCFIESQYNDVVSQVGVTLIDSNEEQMSEVLRFAINAFYKRVNTFGLKSKSPIPAGTVTALAIKTITPSPTPTQIYGLLLSPDKTKKVQSRDWNNYEVLTTDGKVLWSVSYENKLGALEPGWHPFYWSLNGRYIYFTCYHGPDDGSTKFFGNALKDGDCVYRFDVDTGKLIEVVPEILPGYYAFAISPDGSHLVYANQTETPVKIKLLDLNDFTEQILFTADEKILEMGSFGWSPELDKIIFTTLEMAEDKKRAYSIFILDLKSLKAQVLISDFDKLLGLESWDQQGRIFYHDTYRTVWELNLESQMLAPLAVPTLTLSP